MVPPAKRRISSRGLLRAGVICLLLITSGAGGYWLWHLAYGGMTVKKLDRLMREEVPIGSEREQAEVWFRKHSVQYHCYGPRSLRMITRGKHQTLPGVEGQPRVSVASRRGNECAGGLLVSDRGVFPSGCPGPER
jgi:hypothetical protein